MNVVVYCIDFALKNIFTFYYATIAYHVGLNAYSDGCKASRPTSKKKKTFIVSRSLRLSSHDQPHLSSPFSLAAAILESLGSFYYRFLLISQFILFF